LVSCWIDKMEVVKKILQDESEKSWHSTLNRV
jgi:hypothetical protein